MSGDLWTVVWKEWKELFARQGRFRGGALNFALVLGVFGVFMPWQFGRAWVDSPTMLVYWAWVPLLMVSNVVVDAIAGERERHTLETLLASRLSDRAIVLGKMTAAVAYGLAVTAGTMVLGLVTVNVLVSRGALLVYPAAALAGGVLLSVLGATLTAALGVLISLHAATVRQAGQLMGVAILLLVFGPVLLIRAVARHWMSHGPGAATPQGTLLLGLLVLGVFLVVDAGLVAAALASFRRSRLILS